jgi:hypothetical protein
MPKIHKTKARANQVRDWVKDKPRVVAPDLVPRMEAAGFFDDKTIDEWIAEGKLRTAEQYLRGITDEAGYREWGNIEEFDEDGNKTHAYYQLRLCETPKLRRVQDYYIAQATAMMTKANHMGQLINERLAIPEQLPFPWLDARFYGGESGPVSDRYAQ